MENKEKTIPLTEQENASEKQERDLFGDDWKETSSAHAAAQPQKRKRHILPALIFSLALILCSLLGVLFMATRDGTSELKSLKTLEQEQYDAYDQFINAASKPEGWDDQVFARFKQEALAAYDRTQLETIDAALAGDETAKAKLKSVKEASAQTRLEPFRQLFANPQNYPVEVIALAASDPGQIDFVLAYPQHVNDSGKEENLSVDLSVLPDLKTTDPNWGYVTYGNGLMAQTGSAPAAIADVFSYLLKDPSITPLRLAREAMETSYAADPIPEGMDGSIFGNAALMYGVSMTPIPAYRTQIDEALDVGDIVVVATGSRENPQFLVIGSKDANGNWVVTNPASSQGPESVNPDSLKDSLISAYTFWVE